MCDCACNREMVAEKVLWFRSCAPSPLPAPALGGGVNRCPKNKQKKTEKQVRVLGPHCGRGRDRSRGQFKTVPVCKQYRRSKQIYMSSGVVLLTNVDVWNDGLRFLVDECFQTYGDMLMFGMTEQMVSRAAQRLLTFNSRCRPARRNVKRRRLSMSAAMIIWEEEDELPE